MKRAFDIYTSVTVALVDTAGDGFELFYPTPNTLELVYMRMIVAENNLAAGDLDIGAQFIPAILPKNANVFTINYASSGSGIVTARSNIPVNLFSDWRGSVLLEPDMSNNGKLGDYSWNVISTAAIGNFSLSIFFGFNYAPDGK